MESTPQTLRELLLCMRQVTSAIGLSQVPKIFDHFEKVTGSGIQLHYDIRETNGKNQKPIPGKYESLTGCTKAVLVLTHKKDYEGTRTRIQRETNGAVVLFPEWKLLSLMPSIPATQPSEKELKTGLSKYEIYPLLDGTIVTYYHYNGEWIPSTANSANCNNLTWIGECDYAHALAELFAAHPEFKFGRMKKDRCYTFVFKHSDFHPFSAESPRITFIQSRSLTNLADISRTEDIGVPICAPVNITGEQMISKNAAALSLYEKTRNVANICYGYILRAKNPDIACDYIVESTLMTYIRKVAYDLPLVSSSPLTLNRPIHRVHYYILRAILVHDFNVHFLNIFPQYEKMWDWCENLLVRLTKKVIAMHAGGPREGVTPTVEESTARMLMEKIRPENVNINSAQTMGIISDLVRDHRNLDIIHACIVSVHEAQTARA